MTGLFEAELSGRRHIRTRASLSSASSSTSTGGSGLHGEIGMIARGEVENHYYRDVRAVQTAGPNELSPHKV